MEIYDRLLQFTLFQGMSHADLMQVAGHTKFDFSKLPSGKRLVRAGEACNRLIFVTSGHLIAETQSDVGAPYTIQPANLFGIAQRYTTTFRTETPCSLITLDKQEILLLLETQLVFRLNMLNLLATESQRLYHNQWRQAPTTLRLRLTRYFFSRSIYPAGAKTFHILMKQLASDLNASRIDVSKALNQLQADGLLTLHRGRIEIPSLERLLM